MMMTSPALDRIVGELFEMGTTDNDCVFFGLTALMDDIVELTDYLLDPDYGMAIDQDDRIDALSYISSKIPFPFSLADVDQIYVLHDNLFVKMRKNYECI